VVINKNDPSPFVVTGRLSCADEFGIRSFDR